MKVTDTRGILVGLGLGIVLSFWNIQAAIDHRFVSRAVPDTSEWAPLIGWLYGPGQPGLVIVALSMVAALASPFILQKGKAGYLAMAAVAVAASIAGLFWSNALAREIEFDTESTPVGQIGQFAMFLLFQATLVLIGWSLFAFVRSRRANGSKS